MKLPFTIEQFFQVFRNYNQSTFPLQIFFYVLAGIVVFLAVKKLPASNMLINFILAFLWLWMGVVYHLLFFTAINPAAYLFGTVFIVQGLLLLYIGVIKEKLAYHYHHGATGWLGMLFVVYALVFYPLLGYFTGHVYPASPSFGVPCPTTIFTFGILLWSSKRVPWWILIIPVLWSVIGFSAAFHLKVWEDIGLVIAGLVSTTILLLRKMRLTNSY